LGLFGSLAARRHAPGNGVSVIARGLERSDNSYYSLQELQFAVGYIGNHYLIDYYDVDGNVAMIGNNAYIVDFYTSDAGPGSTPDVYMIPLYCLYKYSSSSSTLSVPLNDNVILLVQPNDIVIKAFAQNSSVYSKNISFYKFNSYKYVSNSYSYMTQFINDYVEKRAHSYISTAISKAISLYTFSLPPYRSFIYIKYSVNSLFSNYSKDNFVYDLVYDYMSHYIDLHQKLNIYINSENEYFTNIYNSIHNICLKHELINRLLHEYNFFGHRNFTFPEVSDFNSYDSLNEYSSYISFMHDKIRTIDDLNVTRIFNVVPIFNIGYNMDREIALYRFENDNFHYASYCLTKDAVVHAIKIYIKNNLPNAVGYAIPIIFFNSLLIDAIDTNKYNEEYRDIIEDAMFEIEEHGGVFHLRFN